MGETSNFYEKCSSLSKKGDEKSLRTLLQMGISGNKTARVALRKTRNKKLLKTLIDEYLDNIPSEYNAGMILNLAVKVLRKEYLYECFLLGKHTVERVCSGLSPLRRDRLWC